MTTAFKKQQPRVLSGMRPTGKLHLGHYVGALENWVRLQEQYECFFFVADWHALTTDYADTSLVKRNSIDMVLDWLAAGLDPEKATLFTQSHVPEHAELHLLLSLITPLGWLERVPTYKEQRENIKDKDLGTYGFLGYPVLQSADILIYQADYVPVGEDQVPHIELTREIARRFNQFYPREPQGFEQLAATYTQADDSKYQPFTRVLPEPQPLLTPAAKLPGTDGRKMSKSYGNAILLTDSESAIREKLRTMVNDPARAKRSNPGNPEVCPVGDLHKVLSDGETNANVQVGCRTAGISCIECKEWAANSIVLKLGPIADRRFKYENNPKLAVEILENGTRKAQQVARSTMQDVREAMHLSWTFDGAVEQIFESSVKSHQLSYPLKVEPAWWDLDRIARADRVRDRWISSLPSQVVLRRSKPGLYVSGTGRRVGVHTARESQGDNWKFKVPDRHHDILVLLAWHSDRQRVTQFVLPQKLIQSIWKKLLTVEGDHRVVHIQRNGGVYQLLTPREASIPITEYANQLKPLLP